MYLAQVAWHWQQEGTLGGDEGPWEGMKSPGKEGQALHEEPKLEWVGHPRWGHERMGWDERLKVNCSKGRDRMNTW